MAFRSSATSWHVEEPLFCLVVARVLDGADQASALSVFEEATHAGNYRQGRI